MENWQLVLYYTMASSSSPLIVAIFYIAWIFLGNFILLNLFLAVLLDSFNNENVDAQIQEEAEDLRRHQALKIINKRKRMDKKKLNMDLKS